MINNLKNDQICQYLDNYMFQGHIIKISQKNFRLLKTKSLDNLVPEYVGNFEVK